jgi:hypothetical protein
MSSILSSSEVYIPFAVTPFNAFIFAISIAAIAFFASLKLLYGTFSLSKVRMTRATQTKQNDRYTKLFSTRDQLLYHISWAKSRGEHDEARGMTKELERIDEEIDQLEDVIRKRSS